MSAATVLVVDNEAQIRRVLRTVLASHGYSVSEARSGEEAVEKIRQEKIDLILLDVNMPGMSGMEACAEIRRSCDAPIIMLTVRNSERDKVQALDAGADDYVVKPFSPREVVARVRAVLRRATKAQENGQNGGGVLQIRDLQIDTGAHEVRLAGNPVSVTPAEFRILTVLAQNAGQVLTRGQLLDLVHDDGSIFERTLDRHINNLRRKVEPHPEDPEYILTVYGVGYKLRKD